MNENASISDEDLEYEDPDESKLGKKLAELTT